MKKLIFLISVFSKILTCVVLATAFFATVWNGAKTIDAMVLWQMPLVSFLCSVTVFIYPWDRNMTKPQVVGLTAVHYFLINVIVLGAGYLFYWYDVKSIWNVLAMMLAIALIFGIVCATSWKKSVKEAVQMNEKLKKQFK